MIGQEGGKLLIGEIFQRVQIALHDSGGIGWIDAAENIGRQVEHEVFLHTTGGLIVLCNDLSISPNFTHRVGFGVDFEVKIAPILEPGDAALRVLLGIIIFKKIAGGIHAEAIHTQVEPKLWRIIDCFCHFWLVIIQIGHATPKRSIIIRTVRLVPGVLPPGSGLSGIWIFPDIPVTVFTGGILGGNKPGVFTGSVIDHKIDHYANTALVARFQKLPKVSQRAVIRVDCLVVSNIVAMVGRWGHDRHQPDATNTEVVSGSRVAIVEVIQLGDDTLEIADTVSIAVFEGTHKNLVKDNLIPPAHRVFFDRFLFIPGGFRLSCLLWLRCRRWLGCRYWLKGLYYWLAACQNERRKNDYQNGKFR